MPNIAAVGDSITVGVGAGGKSYIDILGGQKFAIGGKASYSLLGKVNEAVASNPDYVVIFAGINNPMSARGCRGGWDSSLIGDLGTMYSTVRRSGARVIGVTLIPALKIWRSHYNKCAQAAKAGKPRPYGCCKNSEVRRPEVIHQKILAVNNWIRTNADIVIDAEAGLADDNGLIRSYGNDGIHPNARGQAWIANEISSRVAGARPVSKPTKTATEPSTGAPARVSGGVSQDWKSFKRENPNFDFDEFYKELDEYFKDQGGAAGLLTKYGKDKKLGPEHFKAWQMLQKAKDEGVLLEATFERWKTIIS